MCSKSSTASVTRSSTLSRSKSVLVRKLLKSLHLVHNYRRSFKVRLSKRKPECVNQASLKFSPMLINMIFLLVGSFPFGVINTLSFMLFQPIALMILLFYLKLVRIE